MADTDLPNGYGALNRPPRPIAPPFGMLVNPWPTPDPNQVPGFNVQPDQPPPVANQSDGELTNKLQSRAAQTAPRARSSHRASDPAMMAHGTGTRGNFAR